MPIFRLRLAVASTLLASLALMLAAVAPVLGADGPNTAPAQPTACDQLDLDADGRIVVGGTPLTDEQLASLDADVQAALALAAAVQAAGQDVGSVCVEVETGAEALSVSGDVHVCSVLEPDGTLSAVGTEIGAALLDAQLASLVQGAAAVGEDLCVSVTIDRNQVTVYVELDGCVTATLADTDRVSVDFGGNELDLPADSVMDVERHLELGVATQTQMFFMAELALETGALQLHAGIAEFHFCDAPTSGRVTVYKRLEDGSGPGAPGGAGWTFDFEITGGEIVTESPTTDEEGLASFDYTTGPGALITVTEASRDGYELTDSVCQPISDGGEPLAPVGTWNGRSVTFPAEPGVRTVCIFINAPTAVEPTTPIGTPAAPAGGPGSATSRPVTTPPPTDDRPTRRDAVPGSFGLLLATVVVAAGTLLLATPLARRGR